MMTDGTSFSLNMTLADGQTVSAHGTNTFPTGYGEVCETIRALYRDFIPEEGYR